MVDDLPHVVDDLPHVVDDLPHVVDDLPHLVGDLLQRRHSSRFCWGMPQQMSAKALQTHIQCQGTGMPAEHRALHRHRRGHPTLSAKHLHLQ